MIRNTLNVVGWRKALNVVGWIGTALVFAAVAVRQFRPEWHQYAIYAVWTGLACVVAYTLGQWREIAAYFGRRQARYGAIAGASLLVVLGILIAVNYLSTRRNKRWDLTENSVNSLSEQSDKVLDGLDAPMKIMLFDQNVNFDRYRERLSQYAYASNQVSVEYIDGDRDPARTKKYEVQSYPTAVIEHKGRTEKVTTIEERDLTGAVIRAVTGQQRKMYFVQGHGEKDPKGTDGPGYAGVVGLLTGDNITVEPLVLTQHKDVPGDATVLAIVGPTADFLDTEIEAVKRYLTNGGRLMLMMDPEIGEKDQPLPTLVALAKEWGVDAPSDVVLDLSGRSNSATFAVAAPPYPSNPITQGFRLMTVFPLARSVIAATPAPEGRTVQTLVETAPAAWAETDLKQLRAGAEPQMTPESGDRKGPVPMAVTVSTPAPEAPQGNGESEAAKKDTKPQTRLAIFGDSDFASNAYGGQVGNADFFMNTVNWLTAQENLIAIRPREAADSRLTITPQQMNMVWWFSVLVMPALVLGTGIFTWSRRRRA